jgi:hypothetical protein
MWHNNENLLIVVKYTPPRVEATVHIPFPSLEESVDLDMARASLVIPMMSASASKILPSLKKFYIVTAILFVHRGRQ